LSLDTIDVNLPRYQPDKGLPRRGALRGSIRHGSTLKD
jgi:hypothetical protein